MKIDQLIVQHLYNTKKVTLQGIGTIHLDPSVILPADTDKDFTIPDNAFWFEYNLKAGEDEALVDFIVQQTKKMRPLATSDLESYSMLAKQFLNIGKPLVIEGIGTIQKNQAGIYDFTQGSFITPRIDDVPKQLKEKAEEKISFESESRKKNNSKKIALLAFIGLFALLGGLGIYYYFFSQKKNVVPDTVAQVQHLPDTTAKVDTPLIAVHDSSLVAPAPPAIQDSFNFKIVIREYKDSATAEKYLHRFSDFGHRLMIIKADSSRYLLAMPFTTPVSDTARTRDSLQKVFGKQPYAVTIP